MVWWRTLMLHVSSDWKETMGSPPLAISILFCGRNRATTGERHCQYRDGRGLLRVVWTERTLNGVGAVARRTLARVSWTARDQENLRHGCGDGAAEARRPLW